MSGSTTPPTIPTATVVDGDDDLAAVLPEVTLERDGDGNVVPGGHRTVSASW